MNKCYLLFIIILSFISFSCDNKIENDLLEPNNLQITLIDNNQIKIIWEDQSSKEEKFLIDRKKGEFDWYDNYAEVEANILSFSDNINTDSDTLYSYRIRAFDGKNYSDYSQTITWFSDLTTPIFTGIKQFDQDSIKITWRDNSIGEFSFYLGKKHSNGDWDEEYKILPSNSYEFIDFNPFLYDTTYYKISAACDLTISDNSVGYIILLLPSPSNLSGFVISDCIQLNWTDNSKNETGFVIERKISDANYSVIASVPENSVTYYDEEIEKHEVYHYRVYAYLDDFNSIPSNEVTLVDNRGGIIVPDEINTIQSAIDIANEGDTIYVKSGNYKENIHFNGTNVSLLSTDGYLSTIIDGDNKGSVITFESGESSSSIIDGFTLINGNSTYGGGIYCKDANPTLINLKIENNNASVGGGIYSDYWRGIIRNVIITSNNASEKGGGACLTNESRPKFISTIIYNNTSRTAEGIYCNWSKPTFENVTVYNNSIYLQSSNTGWVNSILPSIEKDGSSQNVRYSNLSGFSTSVGNIDVDPLFIDPSNGDFHLQHNSPCKNAGNPDPIYNDTDGTRNDMGAYGGPYGNW
jgi:hypothetical protein